MSHLKTIENSLALYLIEQQIAEPVNPLCETSSTSRSAQISRYIDGFIIQNNKVNLFTSDTEIKALIQTLSLDKPGITQQALFDAICHLRNSILPIRYSDSPCAHLFTSTMYDSQGQIFEKNEYEIGTLFSDTIKHLLLHSQQYIEDGNICKPTTNLSVNIGHEHIEYNAKHDDWIDFIVHLECCIRAHTYLTIQQNMCSHLQLKNLDLTNPIQRETLLRSYNVFMGSGCLSSIYAVFDASPLKQEPMLSSQRKSQVYMPNDLQTPNSITLPNHEQRMHH